MKPSQRWPLKLSHKTKNRDEIKTGWEGPGAPVHRGIWRRHRLGAMPPPPPPSRGSRVSICSYIHIHEACVCVCTYKRTRVRMHTHTHTEHIASFFRSGRTYTSSRRLSVKERGASNQPALLLEAHEEGPPLVAGHHTSSGLSLLFGAVTQALPILLKIPGTQRCSPSTQLVPASGPQSLFGKTLVESKRQVAPLPADDRGLDARFGAGCPVRPRSNPVLVWEERYSRQVNYFHNGVVCAALWFVLVL